jgi:hypothetical protein
VWVEDVQLPRVDENLDQVCVGVYTSLLDGAASIVVGRECAKYS